MSRRLVLAALLLVTVSACGFHLRGPRAMPFKSIFLQMNPYAELTVSIKRQLRANGGTVIADKPEDADVRLVVLNDAKEKAILALNANGTVREYQLRWRFAFRLEGKNGKEVLPYNQIYVFRDISFNDNQVLAKEAEENILYRDMENDIVQQLLRRLSVAKP